MIRVNGQVVKGLRGTPPVVAALDKFLLPETWHACAAIMREYGVRTVVPTGLRTEHSCPVSDRWAFPTPAEEAEREARDAVLAQEWARANHPAHQH